MLRATGCIRACDVGDTATVASVDLLAMCYVLETHKPLLLIECGK